MIGRRPHAAFGNSTGDRQMLEYTKAGDGARLAMLVLHDDASANMPTARRRACPTPRSAPSRRRCTTRRRRRLVRHQHEERLEAHLRVRVIGNGSGGSAPAAGANQCDDLSVSPSFRPHCCSPAAPPPANLPQLRASSPAAEAILDGHNRQVHCPLRYADRPRRLAAGHHPGWHCRADAERHPPPDSAPNVLFGSGKPLPPGSYLLHWHVGAALGGDVADGDIPFSVHP